MIANNVTLEPGVVIHQPELVNLYGCSVGAGTRIGPFVEIQSRASVGRNCKISSHSFICSGVSIEDGVFIGHGVMFTNDLFPRALKEDGTVQGTEDWEMIPTHVAAGASIGSNATLLCGIRIGAHAMVGAGAVVIHDVPDYGIVAGSPARVIGDTRERKRPGEKAA